MAHQLNSNDQWFLDLHRIDLLTQRPFCSGDLVVVCSKCRVVSLRESWEFEGANKCISCGGTSQTNGFNRGFITFSDLAENNSRWKYTRFRVLKAGEKAKRRFRSIVLSLQAEKRILVAISVIFCVFLAAAIIFSFVDDHSGGLSLGFQTAEDNLRHFSRNVSARFAQIDLSRITVQLNSLTHQISPRLHSLAIADICAFFWKKVLQLFNRSKEFPEAVLSFIHQVISWFQNLF